MTDINYREGDIALHITLENAGALRPFAEQIILATGGWPRTIEDEKARQALYNELDSINKELRRAGFEYPVGSAGVHDLATKWLLRNEHD